MKINYLVLLFILALFGVKVQSQPTTYTDNFSSSVSADWTVVNGTWSVSSGTLQSNTTGADPKKLLLTKTGYNLSSATAQQIVARVRVDSWAAGDEDRAGICLMSTTATDGTHRGYSFLLRPGNTINILSDKLAWASAVSFTWTTGTWYWMKLKIESNTLSGKIWKDGDSEPVSWTITKALGGANWGLTSGYPGVVGSAVTATGVSYDDVTVSTPSAFTPYIENFNSSTICNEWTVISGTWSVSSGVGQESSTSTAGDPKKLQLTKTGFDIANTNPQMVVAKVRVDTWSDGDMARAGVSLLNNASGQGYCLLFHNNHSTLRFLNDGIEWSSSVTFSWSNSTWYWFKIQYEENTLKGKIWADGSTEPVAWTITQSGWTGRATGQAALVSGSIGAGDGYASVSFDEVMFADPRYIMTSVSGVADPTSFSATANGSSQIDLSWAKNGSANNVMVAWNSTNTFGTPTGSYSAGNPISGGGTVLYNGSGTTYNHTGLTPGTLYYYKAWSVDATPAYSAGVTANATTAAAAVIRYVTPTGAGSFDGTSWANAYPGTQLQTAIDASGVTQVWVKAGTYNPTATVGGSGDRYKSFRMKNNVAIYGGFAGTENSVSERAIATNETILSGDIGTIGVNTDNCYHVVNNPQQTPNINSTAILDGFTVRGGMADGSYPSSAGGGIFNNGSSPTLTNCSFSNNSTSDYGSGIYNNGSSPTLTNCRISGNLAGYYGGGIANNNSSPTLTNCSFSGNSAGQYGGGMYNNLNSSPIFTNCIFSSNTAVIEGGGMYNNNSSPLLTNCTFTANSTSTGGYGGGISNNSSYPTFTNCSFSGNSAGPYGGGIYNYGSSPTLKNCIIWGNTATTTGYQIFGGGDATTVNFSCYANGSNDVYGGTFTPYYCIFTDPKFVDAASGDFRLYGNSPCVNTGFNDYNTQPTDIRGQERIQNTTIDMGAYEWTSGTDPNYPTVRRFVTSTGSGSKNGTSWDNAYDNTQLQTAIDEIGVTDVWVAAGTYNPVDLSKGGSTRSSFFRMKNNVAIYGGFAGTETLLSERNVATNVTILSGDLNGDDNYSTVPATNISENCYHVVYNPDQTPDINSTAILDGFTILGGNSNGSVPGERGGGVFNSYSSPTLTNVTISNNSAIIGGGIFNSYSSPTLTNVTLSNNSATYGGGIYNSDSSPTLTNVSISNNLAVDNGGGMRNASSSPTLTNVTISNNSATKGGGIYDNFYSSPTLTNVTISNNLATDGGGIYNSYSSSPTINNSILWGNSATSNGKQIYIDGGTTTLNYSCYSNSTGDVYGTITATNYNITTDPKFVDAATGDFRLYGNSPCVNSGLNSYNAQATDIRGQARIQNTTIDMGAYEWTSGTDPAGVFTPTAQPTNIVFSNSVTGKGNNIIVNFTASASAESYLVIRRAGAAPTFSPVDGTSYSAGTTQGDSYIVYSGTAVSATDANLSSNTYYYKIFSYNGSSNRTKYLNISPLTGSTVLGAGSTASLGNTTGSTSGVGFPSAGVAITFPNGTSGASLTVTKTNSVPASNFSALPGVRGMKNLYFTIDSDPESPGNYTLVLDFSGLTGMNEAKWNSFKIMKRADATESWKDVTAAPYLATIANRQTDGIWGKFTITGLNSFSEFGGGEGAITWTVTSASETGAGTLKQLITDASAGDIIIFNTTSMGGNAITLTTPVVIDKDLTIRGAVGGIILDGNNVCRVMQISDAKVVRLEKLIIQNGFGEVGYAGGIWNNGDLTMVNCVVSGNKETGNYGVGGILQYSSPLDPADDPNDVLNLINCTITGNDGSDPIFNTGIGGLSATGGTVKIHNSIIYGNTGDGYTDIDETMTIDESYHSCIGNLANADITMDIVSISDNPLFAGAGGNPTHPYSIQSGSPCKDAGYNDSNFETTDIRGQNRIYNSTIDMGAYEWNTADSYSDLTWDGSAGTDWATAANWTPENVPSANYNIVLLNNGPTTWPLVAGTPGSPSVCHNLTIGTSTMIAIPAGKALTVNGTLTNNEGNAGLIIESDETGTGSLLHYSDNVGAFFDRYITGNAALTERAYHQAAVPLESDLEVSGLFEGSYLYHFDVPLQDWVSLCTGTTNLLDKNQGYLIYYPGENIVYSFEGPLRNGAITLLTEAGVADNHFLVPNPYPSAIDWGASSGWTKTNLYDAIWIWNPVAKNYAAYGTEAGTNGATRYIPQGQAFFVRAEGGAATFALNNSVRVHSDQEFFKSGGSTENMLRIQALAAAGSDEIIVRFTEDAFTGFDRRDVQKMNGDENAPQLSTQVDEYNFCINSLPMLNGETVVTLNFETQYSGQITFQAPDMELFNPSVSVYLKDNLLNKTINLRNQPAYTFNHNPENAADRFQLVFNGTTGIEETPADAVKMWIAGNTLFINTTQLAGQQAQVEVFNPAGQSLLAKTLVLDELTTMELNFKGFVIVKLTAGKEVMTVKGFLMK